MVLRFCCSSSSSSQVSKLRTLLVRFQVREFLSSLSSSSSSSKSVKVMTWWDFDNCGVPSGVSYWNVAPSIIAAVRANGIKGDIEIHAYGDLYHSSKVEERDALRSTDISLHPFIGKYGGFRFLLLDLEDWACSNPPPAHLFFIFGDVRFNGIFYGILNRLRMGNYNIMLACPGKAHVALCHATTIMWQWSSLLKGEDLLGKHFNYPPGDPFNSWYGNSNVPLENPFSTVEQSTSSQNAEIYKPSSDIKLGEASKSVSRQVMRILSSHPNGISIRDLRAKLTKCDLPLGKRFYGYKKFSNYLVSIPHVQLQYLGEGNFWVRLVPSSTPVVKNKQKDGTSTQRLHNEGKNMDRSADGIPRISSSYVSSKGDDSKSFQTMHAQGKPIGDYVDGKSSFPSFKESNVHQSPGELQKTSLGSEKVVDVARTILPQIQLPMYNNINISRKFDNDIVRSEDVSPEILERINPSQNTSTCNDYTVLNNNDIANCESGEAENKHPTRKEVDEVCFSLFTSTFFSWISGWWTFWKSNTKPDDLTAHPDVIYSREPELLLDSKLSEVDQSASHFEEPKSSELQQNVSHPLQPHWDNIGVSVWWDFDSCCVPSDISFLNVAPSIVGLLRANGFRGRIRIDAYGDVSQLSEIKQEALLLSGIDVHHIPGGNQNSLKWPIFWAYQYPPPTHLFLISGDRDPYFRWRVHRLREYNYNILLACPRGCHVNVYDAATIVWQWSSILKGKYLSGKYCCDPPYWYINFPIEYPLEWYRNSTVLHENLFSAAEEPTSSQNAEIHGPSSYIKLVKVPKLLSRTVREILSSYPNGISIGNLRLQCRLIYRSLNKVMSYEHRDFSNILVSIPHVQLLYIGEGNFCVRLIPPTTSAVKSEQRAVKNSGMPVLFSSNSFWDDVESFVFTSRGLRLLSRSRSREDLALKLQKHGPLFLMSLTKNNILQLVELLIAEKKWLEESPSQAFPFRLTHSVQKSSLMDQSHGANGFRSLFLKKTPQQKSFKHDPETYC